MSATDRLLGDYQEPDFTYNTYDASYIKVRKMPRICGPKLSNCCFVLSIWGMIMLVMMGIFFKIESVALLEDIPVIAGEDGVEKGYHAASMNCFVAAGIYGVVFFASLYQKWAISRGYSRF